MSSDHLNNDPQGKLFTDIVLDVFKLSGLLTHGGDQLTREFGLTSARWKVLGALSLAAEPLTVPQIAGAMGQTRQGVQRLVNEMSRDQLLVFRDNPFHKRAKLVVLTAKGKEVYEQITQKQIPWASSTAAGIGASDLEVASLVLKALIAKLER